MSTSVTMPALGESVTEGTVTRWLKQQGELVEVDEPLLEVSTDKVDTEIPSPAAGVLDKILVAEDETVGVGAELAVIGDGAGGGGHPSGAHPEQARATVPEAPSSPAAAVAPELALWQRPPSAAASPSGAGGRYVAPLLRRLAVARGVDLRTVTGTGTAGRIRKQDVLAAAEKSSVAPAPALAAEPLGGARTQQDTILRGRTEKLSRLVKVIARRMVESMQVSTQLTAVVEADVTRITALLDQAARDFGPSHGVGLSYLPFFAKAAAEALKVDPALNCSIDIDAGTVTYHDTVNLGIAVDTDRGVLVPVVRDAGDLNLGGLARRIADLAERARAKTLTPDELHEGTFTLTDTGSRGTVFDTPIINQPQVAVLGIGSVVRRPVVVQDAELGEAIAVRSMVYVALTYDHRIVDGADAARFLADVRTRLEAGKFHGELGPT